MKTIFKTMMTVAALAMAFACSKEEQQGTESIEPRGTIKVSIDGVIDGYTPEDTKASTETVVRLRWDGGETVYAYEGTTYLGSLTASIEGTDGLYAKLSGTIAAPAQGKTVTLVYSPQFAEAPVVGSNRKITLDIYDQSNADYNKVPFLVYGTTKSLAAGVSNLVVNFALATSVYKVNCANLAYAGSITLAKVSNVNTVCELTLSDNAAPVVGGSKVGHIRRSAGFRSSGGRAYVNFAVVSSPASTSRSIKIVKNGVRHNIAFDSGSFAPGKSYNTISAEMINYPDGAVPGVFSVGDKKVVFSKGNLYWDGDSYEFETNQYDFAESWNQNHVSHFYWTTRAESARKLFSSDILESRDEILFTEVAGFTANGQGDNFWRTLSKEEWDKMGNRRTADSKSKYGLVTLSISENKEVTGVMIIPDSFDDPFFHDKPFKYLNRSEVGLWRDNVYTTAEMIEMEAEGAVFLPWAGDRKNDNIYLDVTNNHYWSSTIESNYDNSTTGQFHTRYGIIKGSSTRSRGQSIRLVSTLSSDN